jgi:hypothetical protein
MAENINLSDKLLELVLEVKAYRDRMIVLEKSNELKIVEIMRLYPIIEQKKYFYNEKFILKLLSDSIARVTNCFLNTKRSTTKVLAISWISVNQSIPIQNTI